MSHLVHAEPPNGRPANRAVTDTDKPLRRRVAMAYRTAREAGHSHHHALDAAEVVYFRAHPEELADRLEASARVDAIIASAINFDPRWFWKNVHALIESGQLSSRPDARSSDT
jgi:hypothetical protein